MAHLNRWLWTAAFIALGAASLWLGTRWNPAQQSMNLWCDGQRADYLEHPTGQHGWLLSHFSLSLRPDGSGHYRLNGEWLSSANNVHIGSLHRHTAFRYQRDGQRLVADIARSGKSETDSLTSKDLEPLGLFMFQPGASLAFSFKQLSDRQYLLDDGLGNLSLCQAPAIR
jgi:hypothetical protein